MALPYLTEFSSRLMSHGIYCVSDLVFQTGAIIINDKDEVLLVEDSFTHVIGLPRSRVPYCLDDLLRSPLGYLVETGYVIDRLPLCKPTRRYRAENPEEEGWPAPELTFSDTVTTAPFSIAVDIGYLPASNLPGVHDGRQSILWWYGGILRAGGQPAAKPTGAYCAVHFLSVDDAVELIQNQDLYDVVAVEVLRFFKKILAATKDLPLELRQLSAGDNGSAAQQLERRPEDSDFYTPAMVYHPVFPVATPNSTPTICYAFWPAADYIVRTGVVLFDKRTGCVYVEPGTVFSHEAMSFLPEVMTFPRSSRDNGDKDPNKLLLDPFSCVKIACTRLALPRIWKKYIAVPGQDTPRSEAKAWATRTTDPFLVTFHTWWDLVAKTEEDSQGRQAITYWYAGSFDSSAPLGKGRAVPISEAMEMLEGKDHYARNALKLFNLLWRAMMNGPKSDSSDS